MRPFWTIRSFSLLEFSACSTSTPMRSNSSLNCSVISCKLERSAVSCVHHKKEWENHKARDLPFHWDQNNDPLHRLLAWKCSAVPQHTQWPWELDISLTALEQPLSFVFVLKHQKANVPGQHCWGHNYTSIDFTWSSEDEQKEQIRKSHKEKMRVEDRAREGEKKGTAGRGT